MIHFAQIPNQVIDDKDLDPNAFFMYCKIVRLSTRDGFCYASNEYFAKSMNCSTATVKRALKILRDKDYVFTKEFRKSDKTTRHIYVRIMDAPELGIIHDPQRDTK